MTITYKQYKIKYDDKYNLYQIYGVDKHFWNICDVEDFIDQLQSRTVTYKVGQKFWVDNQYIVLLTLVGISRVAAVVVNDVKSQYGGNSVGHTIAWDYLVKNPNSITKVELNTIMGALEWKLLEYPN